MIALIDGDILLYRIGFTTQDKPLGIAQYRMDESLEKIFDYLETEEYILFLSPVKATTFRHEIHPDYKAKRTQEKPIHLADLREYLHKEYTVRVAVGEEADDLIGKTQGAYANSWLTALENHKTPPNSEPCIVSIDKDLNQIPGYHFNFVKEELYHIEELEALKHFYRQLLTGDSVDNIPGIPGIGPVKSDKILIGQSDELSMWEVVQETYKLHFPNMLEEQLMEMIKKTADLLWIRKFEREEWQPPLRSLA